MKTSFERSLFFLEQWFPFDLETLMIFFSISAAEAKDSFLLVTILWSGLFFNENKQFNIWHNSTFLGLGHIYTKFKQFNYMSTTEHLFFRMLHAFSPETNT